MKTLKDFTPEIQAKIPEYIARYTEGVFDGGRYNSFNQDDAEALIHFNYTECGYKLPVVITAENPYEQQIIFNWIKAHKDHYAPILYAIYCLKNGIDTASDDTPLDSQLFIRLNDQLISQLHSQLDSQLKSQLDSQLYSQLDSQLRSQLRSQLNIEFELDDQLHSQLYDQLGNQLGNQLDDQFSSQFSSQLFSRLRDQLYAQLNDQLNDQLYGRLNDQLYAQLETCNESYLFTANVWSNAYFGWFKFMKDEFNIEAEINAKLDSWNDLYMKSGVYSAVFSELLCVVSKYPKKVHRNANNDLHNVGGPAVVWGKLTDDTGFDGHYLNGREVPEWVITDIDSDSYFSKFMDEENEDIRAGVVTAIKEKKGSEGLLRFLKADLVDEKQVTHHEGYTETLRLYKTKDKYSFIQDRHGNMNQPYCWSEFTCPSTGQVYLIDNSADFTDAVEAAKFLRPSFVPMELAYRWAHSAN